MADSTSTPSSSRNTSAVAGLSSCFQRTVSLYDWWLIKAENDVQGKRLAVAGVTSTNTGSPFIKGALRVFVSAPVIKRYDVFSLETADGVCVIIKGFINEQRTLENGFPPEVFNCFLFGFPSNWERYALDCFREESATGVDSSSAVPDNLPAIEPEILSDGVEKSIPTTSLASPEDAPGYHEKPFPEDGLNTSMETGTDNVVDGSARNRRSTKLHDIKGCQQKNKPTSGCPPKPTDKEQISTSGAFLDLENPDVEGLRSPVTPVQSRSPGQVNASSEQLVKKSASRDESATGVDLSSAVPDNVPAIEPEFSSDGIEKSIPTTSLALPEDASRDHEKPFPEDGFNASNEMVGVNVVNGSVGNRRSTRLHNIEVCQQKNTPASGCPPKHTDKEQISTSGAFLDLENPDGEGLKSPVTPVQSQSLGQVNASSEQLVKKSASRFSRALSPNTEVCYNKKRVTAKTKAFSPKRKITKSSSAVKYPRERDESPLIKGGKQKISSVSPKSLHLRKSIYASIDHEKPFPEDGFNASNEVVGVNVVNGSAGNRRSTRLHNIEICQQKNTPASGCPPQHTDKVQISTSGSFLDLENPDGEGLKSPVTLVQSQSLGQVNASSEQLVKKSASRFSRALSPNTEGCYNKKRVTAKTKAFSPRRKITKSASAVKYPRARERDESPLIKGGKQKISSVSPKSLSLRKSRSGRLLLPPLEFWRNQIPVYNADREISEIQDGASLVSPFKGSSPSLNRS